MSSERFQQYQIGEHVLVIKATPLFADEIKAYSTKPTFHQEPDSSANGEWFASKLVILYQNQLIHGQFYVQERCIVFNTNPKKIFKEDIPLVFRVLKEVYQVSNFYLKKQYEEVQVESGN